MKNEKIYTEYIGAGLFEAFIVGTEFRAVGCNELEAIYNLIQNESSDVYKELANVEYIGYGLYEAQKEGSDFKVVSHNEISAIKKLYKNIINETEVA